MADREKHRENVECSFGLLDREKKGFLDKDDLRVAFRVAGEEISEENLGHIMQLFAEDERTIQFGDFQEILEE